MAETLSEKIKAINNAQPTTRTAKKEKPKVAVNNKKEEDISLHPIFTDEYYDLPNGGDWSKWVLLILGIDGILLAFALGRFILFGI